jgi:hypothetical protein
MSSRNSAVFIMNKSFTVSPNSLVSSVLLGSWLLLNQLQVDPLYHWTVPRDRIEALVETMELLTTSEFKALQDYESRANEVVRGTECEWFTKRLHVEPLISWRRSGKKLARR